MNVSLRPVEAASQPAIRRWAAAAADGMSRTRPLDAAADHHDPATGLFWYVIWADDRDVGTVWIEVPPPEPPQAAAEAILGIFIGEPTDRGRGIGTAAVKLAVAAFRTEHPDAPVILRVRRSNAGAVACYGHAGFTITGEGMKTSPSGESIPFYRMSLPGGPA